MSRSTGFLGLWSMRNAIAAVAVALVTSGCIDDNKPPVLIGLPDEVVLTAGEPLLVQPLAEDVDGDPLTFEILNKPAWSDFDTASGRLSGTPGNEDAGVYDAIRISVTDGKDLTFGPAFRVVVAARQSTTPTEPEPPTNPETPPSSPPPPENPPPTENPPPSNPVPPANNPPTISGSPPGVVTVGKAYSFTPSASDPDGQKLTFSIAGKPAWAAFDSGSGRLYGTPTSADVGVHVGIQIRVTDGEASASLPAFEIVVEGINRAPTISGSPVKTVTEGQSYTFRPSASDPDGDPLTFSISGKPSWATFNGSTGQLSGTPGQGSSGTYSNIVISVTDGKLTTSLPAFTITVQQAATGSATLSWSPPTARTDGTALTNLAGYRIHYGTSSGSYPNSITIDNPGITTYVVENLTSGTYYFAMSAFDSAGVESSRTNPVSKTIP